MKLDNIERDFGGIQLGYPLEKALFEDGTLYFNWEITKARGVFHEAPVSEERALRAAGAWKEFSDEKLYFASTTFLEYPCDVMCSTHDGKIYKIGLTFMNNRDYTKYLFELAVGWYEQYLGNPDEVKGHMHIWNTSVSRIRVNYKSSLFGKVNQFQVIARENI